jgi:hypothetical protein
MSKCSDAVDLLLRADIVSDRRPFDRSDAIRSGYELCASVSWSSESFRAR